MLKFIDSNSAEELQEKLKALGPSIQIVSIYGLNHKHWAWYISSEIKKEKKGNK